MENQQMFDIILFIYILQLHLTTAPGIPEQQKKTKQVVSQ